MTLKSAESVTCARNDWKNLLFLQYYNDRKILYFEVNIIAKLR